MVKSYQKIQTITNNYKLLLLMATKEDKKII